MEAGSALLKEIRDRVDTHARPDMRTSIDGLLLSKVATGPATPDYSLTEPLMVVMAQGGKRLLLGEKIFEYRAGQCLIVTANLPVTGHYLGGESLGVGMVLRPQVIAELLLQAPLIQRTGSPGQTPAMATGAATPELLDAVARMIRLLDDRTDAAVLAPLIEREILWRLLSGPLGGTVRQIGLADGDLAHISRAIGWMRDNFAEQVRIDDLARLSGMSPSAFHRHFRAITAMSPLQFQKRIRLQQARTMLAAHPGDVAGVGHRVGYDSPSQFNREYRRLFGSPPGRDLARIRDGAEPLSSGAL